MVNVSNSFLNKMKKIMKEKGISPLDNVICCVCEDNKSSENNKKEEISVDLNFLIVSLEYFETYDKEDRLPFKSFILFKKNKCWLSSDTGAFFHLINSRITLNKKKEIILVKSPKRGRYSICGFVGQSLIEHMKVENLSKKELSENLNISINKLNSILKGETGDFGIKEMLAISSEFQGKNKVSKYSVLIEKNEK
jgi:hypothetical protein